MHSRSLLSVLLFAMSLLSLLARVGAGHAETTRPDSGLADTRLDCPASLSVTSTPVQMPGWQPVDAKPGPLPLERIVIRTAPDDQVGLPQSSFLRLEQGERRTINATWDLKDIRPRHPRLWIACVYTGTAVALVRPVPAEATVCEFQVESTGDTLHESAGCR